MLIVGRDALTRSDSHALLTTARNIATTYKFINPSNGWNGFNILHRSQGEINAL
jgi:NADH-quinone oxidoreductase subunit G